MPDLNLSLETFRLAVESCPSGMIITDLDGKIVLVNAEVERLFGYQREELFGASIDILVPTTVGAAYGDSRLKCVRQPETPIGASLDLCGARKDGSKVPLIVGLNPIRTSGGAMVVCSIFDITERKKAQASLLHYAGREQLFTAVVDSNNDAIITKTLDGLVTGWNPAAERLFGFAAQDAIGKGIDIIVPAELRGEARRFCTASAKVKRSITSKPFVRQKTAIGSMSRSASLPSKRQMERSSAPPRLLVTLRRKREIK